MSLWLGHVLRACVACREVCEDALATLAEMRAENHELKAAQQALADRFRTDVQQVGTVLIPCEGKFAASVASAATGSR